MEDELLFIEESTDPSDQGQSWRMAVADGVSSKQKALQPANSSTNGISMEWDFMLLAAAKMAIGLSMDRIWRWNVV